MISTTDVVFSSEHSFSRTGWSYSVQGFIFNKEKKMSFEKCFHLEQAQLLFFLQKNKKHTAISLIKIFFDI